MRPRAKGQLNGGQDIRPRWQTGYVAGTGMVGSAIVRRLAAPCEIITADRATVDLERQPR